MIFLRFGLILVSEGMDGSGALQELHYPFHLHGVVHNKTFNNYLAKKPTQST